MKLNRYNYEEYFILYLDNELDSESRREVEAFAQANPDLKAELDQLLQSKLSPDTDIVFENKDSLLARRISPIQLTNYEEWLLSYTDNELTEEERKDVEIFAAAHPVVQTELNLLQRAKLEPETIVFPHKESLYRTEEKARVISIRWWRIAAAAILLLGISTTAIVVLNNKGTNSTNHLATNNQGEKGSKKVVTPVNGRPGNELQGKDESNHKTDQARNESGLKEGSSPAQVMRVNKTESNGNDEAASVQKQKENEIEIDFKPRSSELNTPVAKNHNISFDDNNAIAEQLSLKKSLTIPTVTPSPRDTLDNRNVVNPDNGVAYASESGSNKGIRGFFRKVTRTFEKRTNIKATDDDDRLLIAGLAIKVN